MTAPDCRRCDYQDRAERAERAERELRDTYRAALARVAELERERDAALIERDEAYYRAVEIDDEDYVDGEAHPVEVGRDDLCEVDLDVLEKAKGQP